ALGAPRVRHRTALEDDVVDRAFGKAAAHGQAGVPGADDDCRGLHLAGVRVVAVRLVRRALWWGWSRCRRPPSASATGRSALRGPRGGVGVDGEPDRDRLEAVADVRVSAEDA